MRFRSAKLTIAILVILLTAIACSIGIHAELEDSADFPRPNGHGNVPAAADSDATLRDP